MSKISISCNPVPANDALKDILKFNFIRIIGSNFPINHYIAALTTYN
ncbi:MAG: hypothetical protein ACFFFB_12160 [Candidatus Heimdallarchaeota archaeon]